MTYQQATAKSTFNQNQEVIGVYCGKHFTGRIGNETRPTVDGRHLMFQIILDFPIEVYGQERSKVFIETNSTNTLFLKQ